MKPSSPRVLLLYPPTSKYGFGDEWEEADLVLPPLGLLYLASPLIRAGYRVDFADLNVDRFDEEGFSKLVEDRDFILLSCYTCSLSNTERLIQKIRNSASTACIVCGGPHCNIFQRGPRGADYSVIGEADSSIAKLLDSIRSNESLEGFPGLIRHAEGAGARNPGVMLTADLDSLEAPSFDLIEHKGYGKILPGLRLKIAPLVTARGCPYRCTFCTYKGHPQYRERSVASVLSELKELKARGYDFVVFCDDNFLLNKQRAHRILDRILEERLGLKFVCQARVDTADHALYRKLRQAGVIIILFGIENVCQEVLDFYNKEVEAAQIREAVEMANRVGILTGGFLILGSPLETREHVEANRRFFSEVPLDFCSVSILNYVKGTKIWEDARQRGLIREDEEDVVADERLSNFTFREWVDFKGRFVDEFYKSPVRLARMIGKTARLGVLWYFIRILFDLRRFWESYFLTEEASREVPAE